MKKIYIQPNSEIIVPDMEELMGPVVGSEQTSNPEDWNSNQGFMDFEDDEESGNTSRTSINPWERSL